ncbi:hypothetical protein GCM10011297_19650 [Bacterioplanes sanyensis]|uniref:hypothetical protein n=1 Tax=Bacterioplanes sanyensis TaxID=1249553 RepID=UPI00167B933F|nr:hypothetical protein [Bacterioplanes sanyensis]GGY46840.1 hypothetical protein GCM10011297_19650 [Bacterioplanes sanyensis]
MQHCHAYVHSEATALMLDAILVARPQLQFEVLKQDLTQAQQRYQLEASPQLLILDLSAFEQEQAAIDALLALADVCAAHTRVLALGQRQDVAFFKRLTALGVGDYVPLPCLESELRQHVSAMLTDDQGAALTALHTRQIVVSGVSGGVGASSIAAQLSRNLAEQVGMHLGLVDIDAMGGALDLYLGQEANPGFANLLTAKAEADELLVQRAGTAISERLTLFKTASQQAWLTSAQLLHVRQQLAPWFSALLWDLPSHQLQDADIIPWWQQANDVLLVAEASIAGVRAMQRILELANGCQGQVHWLINSAHGRGSLLPEEVLKHTGLSHQQVSWLAYDKRLQRTQELGQRLGGGRFARSLQRAQQDWLGSPVRRPKWLPGLNRHGFKRAGAAS